MRCSCSQLRLSGAEPDGDTLKFQPDDKHLVELLPHTTSTAKFNLAGITSIRFEGIDTLETHFEVEGDVFHQQYDLAIQARDTLLPKAGFGKIEYFEDKTVQSKISRTSSCKGLSII